MNKYSRLAIATTCGVYIFAAPALAKMDKLQEQQFSEATQAARSLEKSKDFAKAREKYGEAREIATRASDKKKEVNMLWSLGKVSLEEQNYPAAEASFREALTTCEANPELGDGQLASCLYDLSNVLIQQKKKDKDAGPYFERCIDLSKTVLSSNHPVLATREGDYSALLIRLGEKAEGTRRAKESQDVIDAFMGDMNKKIKRAWHPPAEKFSYRVGVSYVVLDHGKVGAVEVASSSGSAEADRAAIAAIKDAAPFTDITSSNLDYKIELLFTLEYNRLNAVSAPISDQSSADRATAQPSRAVLAESAARLKEEQAKGQKLKEQIESAIKSKPTDATDLANLYVQYAETLWVQGEQPEAVTQLKQALNLDCFRGHKDGPAISLLITLGHTYSTNPSLGQPDATLKEAIGASAFAQAPVSLRREALEDYAQCLNRDHKYAEAQDYYTQAREIK